jgi:hypothetical protein
LFFHLFSPGSRLSPGRRLVAGPNVCHTGAGRYPGIVKLVPGFRREDDWLPGQMFVIPAQGSIQTFLNWFPAFAGKTTGCRPKCLSYRRRPVSGIFKLVPGFRREDDWLPAQMFVIPAQGGIQQF